MVEFIDYILNHSWEILRLTTSFMVLGLGLFFLYICRVIFHATRLIRKVNGTVDNVNKYIRKPITVILTAQKFFSKMGSLIVGKDR